MSTKEQLKQIARDKLQRGGVRSLTMRDLGEKVGIKSSSVMYHFTSKDGLLLELASDYRSDFLGFLAQVDKTVPTAKDRMSALLDMIESITAEGKFCLCGMMASDLGELDEATITMIRRYFRDFEAWVAGVLQQGGREACTAEFAGVHAQAVVAAIEGAMLLDKSEGNCERVRATRSWVMSLMA